MHEGVETREPEELTDRQGDQFLAHPEEVQGSHLSQTIWTEAAMGAHVSPELQQQQPAPAIRPIINQEGFVFPRGEANSLYRDFSSISLLAGEGSGPGQLLGYTAPYMPRSTGGSEIPTGRPLDRNRQPRVEASAALEAQTMQARGELLQAAKQELGGVNSPRYRQFEDNLRAFETGLRGRFPDRQEWVNGQLRNCYAEVQKLLKAEGWDGSQGTPDREALRMAAETLVFNAANMLCRQGNHPTCQTAATCERMGLELNPQQVFQDVAKIALTGDVGAKTSDGQDMRFRLSQQSLTPDMQASNYSFADGPHAGHRNYASQLYALATLNKFYAPRGQMYIQERVAGQRDGGDRLCSLTGYSTSDGGTVAAGSVQEVLNLGGRHLGNSPTIDPNRMTTLAHLAGVEGNFVIGHQNLRGNLQYNPHADSRVTLVNSNDGLKGALERAQQAGHSAVIVVDAGVASRLWPNLRLQGGGGGGGHVLTASNLRQDARGEWVVDVRNQWSAGHDKTVSVAELHDVLLAGEKSQQAAAARRSGQGTAPGGSSGRSSSDGSADPKIDPSKERWNLGPENEDTWRKEEDYQKSKQQQLELAQKEEARVRIASRNYQLLTEYLASKAEYDSARARGDKNVQQPMFPNLESIV